MCRVPTEMINWHHQARILSHYTSWQSETAIFTSCIISLHSWLKMFSIIPGMLCQQGVHDLLSRVKNHWPRQWQLVQHSPIWMNVWKMTFHWCKVQLHQCLLAQSATKNNIKHQVWGSRPETRGYIDPQFPEYLKSLHASKCQKCQKGWWLRGCPHFRQSKLNWSLVSPLME